MIIYRPSIVHPFLAMHVQLRLQVNMFMTYVKYIKNEPVCAVNEMYTDESLEDIGYYQYRSHHNNYYGH